MSIGCPVFWVDSAPVDRLYFFPVFFPAMDDAGERGISAAICENEAMGERSKISVGGRRHTT
jgi:hypothetical protein